MLELTELIEQIPPIETAVLPTFLSNLNVQIDIDYVKDQVNSSSIDREQILSRLTNLHRGLSFANSLASSVNKNKTKKPIATLEQTLLAHRNAVSKDSFIFI